VLGAASALGALANRWLWPAVAALPHDAPASMSAGIAAVDDVGPRGGVWGNSGLACGRSPGRKRLPRDR
jgi:hypothetical protein